MMVTDARLHGKSQKKAKLIHEMLFLLQFSYKYTVRKKSVNGTSAPPPKSVSQKLPLHTPWDRGQSNICKK